MAIIAFAFRWRTLIAIGATLLTSACGRPVGDVSGEVFIMYGPRGVELHVQPAAGIEVMLVRVTKEFDESWKRTVKEFEQEYGPAYSVYENTKKAAEKVGPQPEGIEEIDVRWGKKPADYDRRKDAWGAASRAKDRALEISRRYTERAVRLIAENQAMSVLTDMKGRYEFQTVPAGRYYLFAHFEVLQVSFHWIVRIEVKPGVEKMHLSNRNANWPFVTP